MDDDGEEFGDPLNVVLIGDSQEVLASLTRSGWSFTHRISLATVARMAGATLGGDPYPVAPVSNLYLFGRKQDFAYRALPASTYLPTVHARSSCSTGGSGLP